MKSLLTIFLLLLIHIVFAQADFHLSSDSDTAFCYRYKNDYVKQFQLSLIEQDTADYSFRFWSNGLVVKVSRAGDKAFGDITRFVEEYPATRKKRIFKRQYILSSQNAEKVLSLADSLNINGLPSDKDIKGWQQGLDGIAYFVESKKDNQYSFKHYWTPTSQDSLPEAIRLLNFITGLENIMSDTKGYKSFGKEIPFDSWSYPGSGQAVTRIRQISNE